MTAARPSGMTTALASRTMTAKRPGGPVDARSDAHPISLPLHAPHGPSATATAGWVPDQPARLGTLATASYETHYRFLWVIINFSYRPLLVGILSRAAEHSLPTDPIAYAYLIPTMRSLHTSLRKQ